MGLGGSDTTVDGSAAVRCLQPLDVGQFGEREERRGDQEEGGGELTEGVTGITAEKRGGE